MSTQYHESDQCFSDQSAETSAPVRCQAAAFSPSQLSNFAASISTTAGRDLSLQADLQTWSVHRYRHFWHHLLHWSALRWSGNSALICQGDSVEEATFFPDLRINYADNLLSPSFNGDSIAITAVQAGRPTINLTRNALRARVEQVAGALRQLGLRPGDRVAAVARNDAEAIIVALATAALGGTFSSAAPEMGADAVIDRFAQIEPSILFAHMVPEPFDTGLPIDTRVKAIVAALPSLRAVVALDEPRDTPGFDIPFHCLRALDGPALAQSSWPQLPFNHPLFIMFSSGTTGRPKCIVHGTGGVLLEQVKEHRLHCDLRPRDKLFFHTSCAWMMWNWQMAALASGSGIVLYNGPVEHARTLWDIVAREAVTQFGTSPPYLRLCAEAGLVPASEFDLGPLRAILSTGSILHDDQHAWVRQQVKPVPLQSISGGTDILGCFVLGSHDLPVRDGESQCRSLGLDVRALGATPEVPIGELVCANPFPSRPLGLLNDADGTRFHTAYFAQNPGFWTQGDLISFSPEGGGRLHGRSDGILNIRGIRVGPSEIYHLLSGWPEIANVMAVEQHSPVAFAEGRLVLLVVLRDGLVLDASLGTRIRRRLLAAASAAHVPEVILQVASLPVTHSGKQSETAMTDAVNGRPVRNINALANPESLDAVRGHAMLVTRHPSVAADAPADPADVVSILRSLWHDMFGALPTGTDDFFDLGGSSLMAVRLFTDIRRLTGLDLPVSLLLRASTFRQLSAALTEAPRSEQPQVVLMRPGIEGHPFFMIHSMAGRVLELWALQRALQTRRPVYGIQARGLEPGQDPQSCIFEMAQDYIKLMRSVQPAGPYSVGGFSFGGLVAFEIARQLAQRGETVERVVLIDTLVHARFMPWKHWLRYRVARPRQDLRNLLRVPPGQRMNYAWQKVNVLLDRWRISRGQTARRPDLVGSVGEDAHLPPELRRVRGGMLIATRRYKPGRFDGRVILIRPEQRSAFDTEPVWQKATKGRVEVRVAPGDHLTMITEPHVQMLARELDRCLR